MDRKREFVVLASIYARYEKLHVSGKNFRIWRTDLRGTPCSWWTYPQQPKVLKWEVIFRGKKCCLFEFSLPGGSAMLRWRLIERAENISISTHQKKMSDNDSRWQPPVIAPRIWRNIRDRSVCGATAINSPRGLIPSGLLFTISFIVRLSQRSAPCVIILSPTRLHQ